MPSAILGSWVVLPEPVSPQTMTTWWAAIAAAISSRRSETGRDSGKVMLRDDKDGRSKPLIIRGGAPGGSGAAHRPLPGRFHVRRREAPDVGCHEMRGQLLGHLAQRRIGGDG